MVGGNYNLYGNVQSVLGKLVITYEDGSQDVVGTGDDWNFTYGPITYADNYRGEGYDARYDHEGWNDVGYTEDPNDWSAALVVDPLQPPRYQRPAVTRRLTCRRRKLLDR